MSSSPTPDIEERRRREDRAAVIAGVAADIDAVMSRSANAMRKLESLDAEPNQVVALRRAAQALAEVAAAVRRDGLLAPDQQRLL